MRRSAVVAAFTLLTVSLLPGPPAAAEESAQSHGMLGATVGAGASLTTIYPAFFQDVSAEVVVADCVAVGGMALFVALDPGEALFVPFIAVSTPRSRPSAPYFTAAWVPTMSLGALALGYEGTLRGPLRLYGELGALGPLDAVFPVLPYGRVGLRLRF